VISALFVFTLERHIMYFVQGVTGRSRSWKGVGGMVSVVVRAYYGGLEA